MKSLSFAVPALVATIAWSSACGSSSSPTAASPVVPAVEAPATVAADPLFAVLTEALQDEYHAENVYARVLRDFGTVFPFANIINAERSHASSIAARITARAWQAPASAWTPDNVPAFASVRDACAAAATAEIENVKLYDKHLEPGTLPDDVRTVFENNRRASLVNHLPAFERCR